jgi:phage repressor protein C with HTH and peptisase S24 domain
MADDTSPVRLSAWPLASRILAHVDELLRLHHLGDDRSAVYTDPRLSDWLAREARATVEHGIAADPWSPEEVERAAVRVRAAALAERLDVRRVSGSPEAVPPPDYETRGSVVRVASGGPAPRIQLATAAGIGREIWDEGCDTWVAVPPGLPRGKYVALNVRGDSMLPLLHDGDTLLVALDSKAMVGDIVLARTDDGYVVKRLDGASARGVRLSSLNERYATILVSDVQRPIVGRVVLRWCPHEVAGSS